MNLTRCDYCGQEWPDHKRIWLKADLAGELDEKGQYQFLTHFCTYSCLMEWADVKLQQYRKEIARGI